MTRVKTAAGDDLRVILCLAFDPHTSLDSRQAFENFLLGRNEVVHALETEGSFDFMIEAGFASLVAYHDFMGTLSAQFPSLIRKSKASFICRRFMTGAERAVWVHHNGAKLKIDLNKVSRVTAEGDYVRLFLDGHDYLHHMTMRAIEGMLDPLRFVRIHRSVILRLSSITRMRHLPHGWVAECNDGTSHRVSRAHADALLAVLRDTSAMPNVNSPMNMPSDENATAGKVD